MVSSSRFAAGTFGLLILAVGSFSSAGPDSPTQAETVPLTVAAASTPVAPGAVQQPTMAAAFVRQINTDRLARHRSRLVVDPALTASAQKWAAQMAKDDLLHHNPRLASSISGWLFLGENVGVGPSVGTLKSAFWRSPHHRANMLDAHYTRVGVAVVRVGGKLWVAEEFSQPKRGAQRGPATATLDAFSAPTPATRTSSSAGVPAGGTTSAGPGTSREPFVRDLRQRTGLASHIGSFVRRTVTHVLT